MESLEQKLERLQATLKMNPKCYPNLLLESVQGDHDCLPTPHWTALTVWDNEDGILEVCGATPTEAIDLLEKAMSKNAASNER